MTSKRFLKRLHVCGTLWFLICAATLLVFSLRQAGFNWWLIFSISGYSAVLFLFVFTIYLFAIYQGVVRHQTADEHPLSTSLSYITLYDLAPFLGALAAVVSLSQPSVLSTVRTVAEGTLVTTFLVWIIFDPVIGLVETLLPTSAAHRRIRLERIRRQKQQQKEEGHKLLKELEQKEQALQDEWYRQFEPMAREAARLMSAEDVSNADKKARLIELGALAWKTGEITCMRYFHRMILDCLNITDGNPVIDYPAIWWDGVGTWRKPPSPRDWYIAA